MKKIIFVFVATIYTVALHSQLTVDTTGLVNIGAANSTIGSLKVLGNRNGIYSEVSTYQPTSLSAALHGKANHHNSEYSYGVIGNASGSSASGRCFGVYGYADGGGNGYNFGVMGNIESGANGAAVYGTIGSFMYSPIYYGTFAGFFDGQVYVGGDMRVIGTITTNHGVYATAASSASASRVEAIRGNGTESISDMLVGLNASTMYIEPQQQDGRSNNVMDESELTRRHYVLDADQLEAVFPDLVRKEEDGTKSINYIEMVPILVQAINELQQEVDELRGNSGQAKKAIATGNGEITDNVAVLSMGQNNPNPFSNTTTIEVTVPEDVQKAFIYIYDLQGKKLQQVDITSRGKQSVSIDASSFVEGMYLYSLIADGKVVDTRRMIVEH